MAGVLKAAVLSCAVGILSIAAPFPQVSPEQAATPDHAVKSDDQAVPWTQAQTIEPAALAKEIADSKAPNPPKIVCAGFHTLYEGAHVPDASFHGPASTPQGLDDLKKWAQPLPRSANIVIYCGCCPLAHCPNARPAFAALRDMGFTRLRVLILPKDFASDWVEKGYPIAKGK